ncbi:LLM class F420-dependent oxidoreductase [Nocardia sp. NPDC056000]|uniref:LLM class F420-dependent oxidoreductase n=1 Tax=Nocardia sp. NPDC056000 TaxID=3345674 RepID=UPI0035DCBF63
MANDQLGKFGVWRPYSMVTPEQVRELEELGYGAVWLGSSPPADWDGYEALLAGSDTITLGTSIVNVWASPAAQAAETFHRLDARFPGRFLLGIGAGHREHTGEYTKPYDALVQYLDELDAAGVPKERRALAALGPKVAELARDRTAGALPYLSTPAHTASLRKLLGPDTLIAPEHKVVLDTDVDRARELGRNSTSFYLSLSNYVNNLRRSGFHDADLTPPGSDRLVDALVLHGTAEQIADAATEHLRAGADHVALQVLGEDYVRDLRALAPVLTARV